MISPFISSGNDGSQCQIEDEDSMYEIPKIKRNLSDSGYEKAVDRSSLSNICESTHSDTEVPHAPAVPQPPPLPPRRERTSSNAASRSSIASILEEKLADLNLNPKLDQETALSHGGKQTDSKSEKMTDGVLDDYAGIKHAHCSAFQPLHVKTNNVVSNQVQHKPSYTATEDA